MSDRAGGGKRRGTRRAFTNAVTNSSASLRILGLNAAPTATTASAPPAVSQALILPHDTATGFPSPTGSWVSVGAASLHACTDDADLSSPATDYASSAPGLSGPAGSSTFRVGMEAGGGVPATGTYPIVRITYRIRLTARPAPTAQGGRPGTGTTGTAGSLGGIIGTTGTGQTGTSPSLGTVTSGDDKTAQETPAAPSGNIDSSLYVAIVHALYLNTAAAPGVADTLVAQFVPVGPPVTTGGWTTQSFMLTAAEVAVITAATAWNTRDKLVVGVTATAVGPGASGVFFDVTQIAIDNQTSGGTTTPPGNTTGKVLILLNAKAYVADLPTDDLGTPATSTGLVKAYPSIDWFNGFWYVVDGGASKRITGTSTSPTVTAWTASTAGTIPAGCRIVKFWRNRAVLARQEGVSNGETLWFMSRVGDPLDWAYAADDNEKPGESSAVAGTNKQLGKPADAITAVIPWTNDVLLFGCGQSIWKMDGDPGYGGTLTNLTQQTGVLSDRAWCFDERGMLWFMGSGGLYRLSLNGELAPVSGRRLYRYLDRIDGANNVIQLAYDAFEKCVYIFVSATQGSALAGCIVYDTVADAFWFDKYPPQMGPWSVCQLSGSTDDDRRFLMGGDDGRVRRPFDGGKLTSAGIFSPGGTARYGTADDMKRDGTVIDGSSEPIDSSVRYAPIEHVMGDRELMLVELQAVGSDDNAPLNIPWAPVNWYALAADSPTMVAEGQTTITQAAATGLWFGVGNFGHQKPVGLRVCAAAHQIVVRQASETAGWAIDRIVAKFRLGPRRR